MKTALMVVLGIAALAGLVRSQTKAPVGKYHVISCVDMDALIEQQLSAPPADFKLGCDLVLNNSGGQPLFYMGRGISGKHLMLVKIP